MNYDLTNLPDIGPNTTVHMDIILNSTFVGKISIKLFRDVFPAGVENFARIAAGKTYKATNMGGGNHRYVKETQRTYEGCKFYHLSHNNYIVCGDIYTNDGKNSGTIYNDKPISSNFGDYYYPHEAKGLVSLVPFNDEATGQTLYDSTFMITLDNPKPSNVIKELDKDQIVIGQVYDGMEVIDKINQMIKPYAGRHYPNFSIGTCNISSNSTSRRRAYPQPKIIPKKIY